MPHRTSRDLCEHTNQIDISRLQRQGCFTDLKTGCIRWADGTLIPFWVTGSELIFQPFMNPHEPTQAVQIVTTQQRLGGERRWFECPSCGRRCAKLYLQSAIACRTCCHLTYECQRENPFHRAISQAQKARMRLGGSADLTAQFPTRPKGMHFDTWERRRVKSASLESRFLSLGQSFTVDLRNSIEREAERRGRRRNSHRT